ncbi:hypothetical protein SPACI_040020 [Sporomusa acidovorans DSM 3132]|uniref:Uncharacterized protein n=1 Tax=Sporomusa acidovorans (strain ATCC 49682 / DSM 3132 / Mol) TaxID=1123286 RepID=A0ABZ3J685_SPOA4|nr:hypothetical protein [Sporomusa acidovorans]OZC18480.1 hypothetical protein SPACI_33460 [Sporomusa acidovorans DSM 3132]SDE36148.1 hypothetical protein SAMN04488499_101216 [Sporomusa acidovorans]
MWESNVDVKVIKDNLGIPIAVRVEYECLKNAAKAIEKEGSGITFHELKEMIESNALKYFKKTGFEINIKANKHVNKGIGKITIFNNFMLV